MQILRKELTGLVTGPVIAAQGACSFMVLSMRKGVLSEHHRALSLAHSHRGWFARCMCVGPSQRENMRALAEYKPKGRLGLGWTQECPIDGTQVPWLFPCFPDCPGPPSPTLCLRAHAHTLFLPPPVPVTGSWSVMTPPSSRTSPASPFMLSVASFRFP